MEINVSQLIKSPVGTTKDYALDDVVDITEAGVESQVKGEVKLIRTNRSVLVKGTLRTELKLGCNRCLKPFTQKLNLRIEEEYFPTIDVVTGVPVELPDEPDLFTIDEHHILSLVEAVRQYALLAIPMKPLCRKNCRGLCPVCGKNLNAGSCTCVKVVDPRWAGLAKLASAMKTEDRTR